MAALLSRASSAIMAVPLNYLFINEHDKSSTHLHLLFYTPVAFSVHFNVPLLVIADLKFQLSIGLLQKKNNSHFQKSFPSLFSLLQMEFIVSSISTSEMHAIHVSF